MYTVVSDIEIVVQFKDVHGVALTVIWIIAAIRQNCMTLLVAIMTLITGALGLCREHTKLCILYFCSAVHIRRILKEEEKKKRYMTAVFLPLCTFLLCYTFPKSPTVNPLLRGRS